jgi:hypothetical protein
MPEPDPGPIGLRGSYIKKLEEDRDTLRGELAKAQEALRVVRNELPNIERLVKWSRPEEVCWPAHRIRAALPDEGKPNAAIAEGTKCEGCSGYTDHGCVWPACRGGGAALFLPDEGSTDA